MLTPSHRLALYMEGAFAEKTGKLGLGVLRYSPHTTVCLIDSMSVGQDLSKLTGISRPCPIVSSVQEAKELGADVLVLGTAPPGGLVPSDWWPALDNAVQMGLSLVNGLHDHIAPRYPDLKAGQFIWDVRKEPVNLGVGTGAARLLANRRVLMVGTDMSVGKMTAGLEIHRDALASGRSSSFVATGQTGIIISGDGVPLDAVRLDYATGAIEAEVCKHKDSELIVVEGQGSLIHPGSSATLPLMRGSCPTHLVLCHRAGMETLPRVPWVRVPNLNDVIQLYEGLASACGTFPEAKVVGIALNTLGLTAGEAEAALVRVGQTTGLPVCDPVRGHARLLLEAVLA